MKISIKLIVFILCILLSLPLIFILRESDNNKEDNGVATTKTVDKFDKNNLTFNETLSISMEAVSTNSNKIIETIKHIDAFNDSEKNTFYYISDTEILCGFQKEYYYGFYVEQPIIDKEAIMIASAYLSKIFSEFSEYSLILSEYSESDMVFHLQYSYLLNNTATDDLINIFIQGNGEVGAFMAFNRGAYRNVEINLNDLQKFTDKKESDNLVNQYITMNEEGLILLKNYLVTDQEGNEIISQIATLIK